jgi:hypothetical protein
VWPVQGALTLNAFTSCSPLTTSSPLLGPFPDADVVLRVFIAPLPSGAAGGGGAPPSSADACAAGAAACAAATQPCADDTLRCVGGGGDEGSAACVDATAACLNTVTTCETAAARCAALRAAKRVTNVGAVRMGTHAHARPKNSQFCASGSFCIPPFFPTAQLAFASTCARDAYDRPIAGVLTYVPGYLAASPTAAAAAAAWAATPAGAAAIAAHNVTGANAAAANAAAAPSAAQAEALLAAIRTSDAKQMLFVTLHEMGHALGFTASSVPLFRDASAGGARRVALGNASAGATLNALGALRVLVRTDAEAAALPSYHECVGVTDIPPSFPQACRTASFRSRPSAATPPAAPPPPTRSSACSNSQLPRPRPPPRATSAARRPLSWGRSSKTRTPRAAPRTGAIGRCGSSRES